VIRLRPSEPKALAYDKPLCASKDGFTLHAATRAGAAELLARTFAIDALACPVCRGRMRLIAVLKHPASIARYLAGIGEPTELPARSPDRGPPHWKSTILRRQALGYEDA
jgi:uncharacterized protein YbaR (Trm112 family)